MLYPGSVVPLAMFLPKPCILEVFGLLGIINEWRPTCCQSFGRNAISHPRQGPPETDMYKFWGHNGYTRSHRSARSREIEMDSVLNNLTQDRWIFADFREAYVADEMISPIFHSIETKGILSHAFIILSKTQEFHYWQWQCSMYIFAQTKTEMNVQLWTFFYFLPATA